ncbi:hypothetical protein [Rhizobium sp. T1470]|uniref:hypothetical protein n=1 Tax=unclassified Rhizobium TaxID=2613769 RepID=UPI0035CEE521
MSPKLARFRTSSCLPRAIVRPLWVNPDCGLKSRKWEVVRPALMNMVACSTRAPGESVSIRGRPRNWLARRRTC